MNTKSSHKVIISLSRKKAMLGGWALYAHLLVSLFSLKEDRPKERLTLLSLGR